MLRYSIFDVLLKLLQFKARLPLFAFLVGLRDDDVGVDEHNFEDFVSVGVKKSVIEVLQTVGTGFERVALQVGEVKSAPEPLRTEIAFQLVCFDIVLVRHREFVKMAKYESTIV